MNQEVNIGKKRKRLKLYYGLLVTVICIIGVSFAWFRLYLSQSEDNTLASRTCFNTTLTENTSKITLTDAFPISDEDGLKQTPFTFTLKNNCSSYVKVYITIDSTYRENTSTSYLKDSYMKVNVSPKDTTDNKSVILGNQSLTDLENNRKGYIIVNTGLKANEEKSFDLRIWMDSETTLEQGLNKNWAGKIVVVSNASNGPTLTETILANNEVQTPLTTPGKEVSAHTLDDVKFMDNEEVVSPTKDIIVYYGTGWKANGTDFDLTGTGVITDTYANSYSSLAGKYLPSLLYANGTGNSTTDLSSVYYVVSATSSSYTYKELTSNKNITEALLASTEDDYGTSYYFRGVVKNNYVEFANKCWRIVRINGDGSVKLVLHNDNTDNASNPCSSVNNFDGAAIVIVGRTYTFNDNYDDNSYIGFMYGTAGASNYSSTHANTNKSTILTDLETWYKNNLISYESKLADIIWCNDKSVVTDTNFDPWDKEPGSNFGYGTNANYYSTTKRLVDANGNDGGTGPSLKCPNDNNGGKLSKFTVSDTLNGNGSLTYKIGLLTADEVAFAGLLYGNGNYSTYLQENTGNDWWWSLSPSYFDGVAGVWRISNTVLEPAVVQDAYNTFPRPAISLVSNIEISGGSGTSEDPYVVE